MTTRRPCPPAPGPLEDYATAFDGLFRSLGQRRGFRDYLHGLLLPRDRNKTLTGLAGAEPIVGAQHRDGSAAAVLPVRVDLGSPGGQRPAAGVAVRGPGHRAPTSEGCW